MTEQMYGEVGESRPDNLIADISFPLQTGSAVLKENTGLMLRGTLLGKDDDGKYVKASESVPADRILADDVEVGEDPLTVVAYLSGAFAGSSLIAENDIEEHREVLRTKGIYIKTTVGGA